MYLGGFSTPTGAHGGAGVVVETWVSRLASNIFQFVAEGDGDNFCIITSKANILLSQLWQSKSLLPSQSLALACSMLRACSVHVARLLVYQAVRMTGGIMPGEIEVD